MVRQGILLLLALFLLGMRPAAALYKCTGADGSVSFQQTPCFHGDGIELEASESFGVRPYRSDPIPEVADEPVAVDAMAPQPVGRTLTGKAIYLGPRGGRYTVSESGRKNYLPNAAQDTAVSAVAPEPERAPPQILIGPRGGCYTLGSTGRKNYLPKDQCPKN